MKEKRANERIALFKDKIVLFKKSDYHGQLGNRTFAHLLFRSFSHRTFLLFSKERSLFQSPIFLFKKSE